ncbi:MAG: glutamine synthetase type III [Candidatus Melainabacteria bacterium]|nr:MAG: glutamine synthetase type III [Candidatus Melainabacteria bacterium]
MTQSLQADKTSKGFVHKPNSNGHASARRHAIETVRSRTTIAPPHLENVDIPVNEIFGTNVFNRATMRALLPKNVYKALIKCIDEGERLHPSMADIVANAMKDWAVSRGATHFCHWFLPMTGLTAEKHDSFLVPTGEDKALAEFSGKFLIQGEPDASSFPSGGIRSTFEARGYTGWDPTSPAFLMENTNGKTLCIPSVFYSFSGHALDKKTPLLRSLESLSKQAVRLLHLLGNKQVKRVTCTVGPEQEYFLIDESFYLARPDLINAGRTLFGAKPPKGQEMEDHYWGSIRERILAFMMDAERELYKLGVPVKTRHNEVAPAQFEVAPVFENSNLATDHNMLLMEVFRKTAQRHGLRCLLHEKPFSGINGSGKHNNWSMADDQGNNLLDPGSTPHENEQFLVVLTAVIRAVNQHAKLLRASIAFAANDHRLGANEAPPAIMSIFLGDKLTEVVRAIISGKPGEGKASKFHAIGVSMLPDLPRDDSDRNRTSPFAFTGNKFEFRAVGSSQSIGWPNTVLNTMVAESFDYMAGEIEREMKKSGDLKTAIQAVVKRVLTENERILFNGDNYSAEWHKEAEKRGLPNLRNTIEALPAMIEPEAKKLFDKYGVFNEEELVSRYNIMLEAYCKTINIESLLTATMASTMILPAAIEYQSRLATAISQSKAAIGGLNLSAEEGMLRDLCNKISQLHNAVEVLQSLSHETADEETHNDPFSHARFYQQRVIPAMNEVRTAADELEIVVDDSLWPLPKFREMLYIY